MRESRIQPNAARGAALLALMLVFAASAARGADPTAPPKTAAFGEVFPPGVHVNLSAGGVGVSKVDLKDVIGKKPIVFCYWVPDHPRAEETLQAIQQIADEAGPAKLVAYGVVTSRPGAGPAELAEWAKGVKERIAALKIRIPVLQDDGFRIGRLLGVRSVPSISVLDVEGRLRMANAGSLKQELEYKMDVASGLRRLASAGRIGTYGAMPMYYPALELVGKKCPEFEAVPLEGGVSRSSAALLSADKVNVLIFWSEDCPHCRKSLPQISAYVKSHPDGINVVTAAKVASEAAREETQQFCKKEGLVFTNLADKDLKMGQLFQVTSTPTIFIIRPDGVIDSVLFSGEMDYSATFDAKKKQLLKS